MAHSRLSAPWHGIATGGTIQGKAWSGSQGAVTVAQVKHL
jgi:hypothetical protein